MSKQLSGARSWVIQRLSAMYIALFAVLSGLVLLFSGVPQNHADWRELWGNPLLNISMLVFIVALLLHAWVGIRDVILDYIHPFLLRALALSFFMLALLACGLWAMRVLFNVL